MDKTGALSAVATGSGVRRDHLKGTQGPSGQFKSSGSREGLVRPHRNALSATGLYTLKWPNC